MAGYDPSPAIIAGLEPATASRAVYLITAVRQSGIPLITTSGRRSSAEQAALVAAGRSRTMNSKHLQGKAFDVDIYGWDRNSIPKWFWDALGPWAERSLGLIWGGRWQSIYDPGHFETP